MSPEPHRILCFGDSLTWGLTPLYAAVAARDGCDFFDAAAAIRPSGVDGVHLEAADARAIGSALAGRSHATFPFRQLKAPSNDPKTAQCPLV